MDTNPKKSNQTQKTPFDIIRKVLQDAEEDFYEDDGVFTFWRRLRNMLVRVSSWVNDSEVCIGVEIPVIATEEFRSQTGEFLHRINYGEARKFWEIDWTDGEIRLGNHIDLTCGPLIPDFFRGNISIMIGTADVVFPYLTSVLSGRMTPEFAADQAAAALKVFWDNEVMSKESPSTDRWRRT